MSDKDSQNGLGAAWVIGIVFIILRLTGVIHWSWLWVLAPFWIPLALAGVLIVIGTLIALFINSKN